MEQTVSQERKGQHGLRLLIAAALALLSLGCGSSDDAGSASLDGAGGSAGTAAPSDGAGGAPAGQGGGSEGLGGAGGLDMGSPTYFDAGADGFVSNPIEQLFADPARSPWDFLDAAGRDGQTYVDAAKACYAEPGACDSDACSAFAACCTASGSCCEPLVDAPIPQSLLFGQCQGQSIEACLANAGFDADVFGESAPLLTARGLVPNGSAAAEGGALLGEVVNLSSLRVLAEVQFAPPIGCAGTCLESAGIAFTRFTETNAFGGADVGLLLSGSRELVNLMIGGQVADSFDAGDATTVWRMTLSPAGTVEIERDGASLGVYSFDARSLGQARLALFGRNLGSDNNSAAIARIATLTELCDSPSGWTERYPLEVSVEGQLAPEFLVGANPSISDDPQRPAVAFELGGQIFVGEAGLDGSIDLSSSTPAVSPTEEYEAGGVGDPELISTEGALYLYYTARDSSGAGSIAAAALTNEQAQKGPEPILAPGGDVASYDSPTVAVRDDLAILVVRATLTSGATELRAFYSVDPDLGWVRIVDGTIEALTRIDDPTSEISSPSLIVHNSSYQLYYSRRTGTRWAVELATSDELLFWRPLGETLGASGEGFDSLGARGLDARSVLGRIEAVYSGQNGVAFSLGFAARPAPSDTAPTVF